MIGEQLRGERAVGDVVGRVVVHRQLLEDHLAFAVDVGVAQRRADEHVAEQLDAERRVASRQPAVVRRVLLGGEGVEVAADAVDATRDAPAPSASSVPLNSRCSRKWLTPLSSAGSSREPTPTQTPVATDNVPGTCSVATVRPESS